MTSARVSGRCVGIFIVLGCSLLLLYKIAVQHYSVPSFKEYFMNKATWQCQEEHKVLKTAGPQLCLGTHNVFFIETAESKSLNPRQACAVESAARYHPTYDIMVLMTPSDGIDFEDDVMKVLNSIDNVKVVRVDIATMVNGTPYYKWYKSNVWKNSTYKVVHMSDALRIFLLWTYGGMYLDMDVVVLRPLSSLHNTVVSDNGVNAGSSVMFFDRGHEILGWFMSDFVNNYDPTQFAANGPIIINRNIKKYCHVDVIAEVGKAGCGVDVLPQDRAYPISYERWEDYFSPTNVAALSEIIKNSYLIHAWNFLSSKKPIVIGANSLYEVVMKEHCPLVYNYAKQFTKV